MRRILSLAIVLSLTGLGPAPLSACALFSSKLVECATPKTQARCDQMDMQENGTRLAATPDTSCCFSSSAPLPESQYKAFDLSFMAVPTLLSDPMGHTPRTQYPCRVDRVQDLSPPKLQCLLCIFLI